jgi:muramidase (phage lysozyme)
MSDEDINVRAFLRLIRYAEHTSDEDDVYYIIYGGLTFSDMTKHPNTLGKRWGKQSTAAGAYQILYGTWEEAKKKGIALDFTKESQDKIAVWKLKTRKAYDLIVAGELEAAIGKLRNEWTSLPGAKQSNMTMEEAKMRFAFYKAQIQVEPKK